MKMSFESVYCVTTRLRLSPPEAVEELARTLGSELPVGYGKFLATLGKGELCDWLRVHTPEHVRAELVEELSWWRGVWVKQLDEGRWQPGPLAAADLAEGVRFATSAENDQFICCPRHGPALFLLPRHADVIERIEDGFYGAVEVSRRLTEHDFPFFDTWDREHRWHRSFVVRPELGGAGFIAAVRARWGAGGFRQSRVSLEQHPSLFVRSIGGRLTVYPDTSPGFSAGSFEVGMVYDKDTDPEVATFIETVAVPGSDSLVGPPPWQD
jgi:hypothetical protein